MRLFSYKNQGALPWGGETQIVQFVQREKGGRRNNIVPRFIVVQLWLIKLNFYECFKEHVSM